MNTFYKIARKKTDRRGTALVIVLAMLVLMTVVVLCFFVSASIERRESSAEANLMAARNLSAATVDLVKSTISQATSGYESDSNGALDRTKITSWASQPGLIHTWKQDGTPDRSFRLYSSSELSKAGNLDLNDEAAAFSSWKVGDASFNSLWCDINAPASNKDNVRSYPVMTPPRALDADAGVVTDDLATTGVQEGVQGFSVTSPPGFTIGKTPSAANNPAPMPVKWLYVLKDGRFVNPAATGNPDEVKVEGATVDNPILGRVAYWTDDETCKVNINTASEGTFWGIPTARSIEEVRLGQYQPSRNEFQRYPGHPAATCMSAVFPSFAPASAGSFVLAPRTEWGGSEAGTKQPVGQAMKIRTERLLASVDELIFQASGAPRTQQPAGVATVDQISRARFFLTASSRAPEETLLNTPRISMWPITTDSISTAATTAETRQDVFDKTLKFCGTLANQTYYFTRAVALSPTYDYDNLPRNQQLFAYLQYLTSARIPGYGGSWETKYGADNRDALLTQAFDFIRSGPNLVRTSDMLPTGRVKSGYTVTTSNPAVGTVQNAAFAKLVVPIRIGTHKGMGNFVSITEVGLSFYTEKVEALDMAGFPIATTTESGVSYVIPKDKAKKVRYTFRPLLMVETFSPTLGWARTPYFVNGAPTRTDKRSIRIQATGTSMTMSANPANGGTGSGPITMPWGKAAEMRLTPTIDKSWDSGGSMFSPSIFLLNMPNGRVDNGLSWPPNNTTGYSYRGQPITMTFDVPVFPATADAFADAVDAKNRTLTRLEALLTRAMASSKLEDPPAGWAPRMTFSGGTIRVDIGFTNEADTIAPADIVQSVEVTLPQMTNLPVPTATYNNDTPNINYKTRPLDAAALSAHNASRDDFLARWTQLSGTDRSLTIQSGDVVRSLEISGGGNSRGDWRLSTLQQNVPASWFGSPTAPDEPTYALDSDRHRVHSFSWNRDSMASYAPSGARLVENVKFYATTTFGSGANAASQRPTSSSLSSATMLGGAPGDWSNEIGINPDGALFAMPDIAALGRLSGTSDHYSYFGFPDITTAGTDGMTDELQYKLMYSPNRQMFSPMQFGSLLTQADSATPHPWQTLLFCPNSATTVAGTSHPGEVSPPDHLFADLFWMPVVDPYPISDRLSTAGKINLNYQIAPFTHIRRATGLYALLKAMKITALADSLATGTSSHYKMGGSASVLTYPSSATRYDLAIEETLKGMDARFSAGEVFRSASAIAECFLYPASTSGVPLVTYAPGDVAIKTWWKDKRITGDNSRENPYSQLYPRVTTKSNTFTVHYRVQSLKKVRTDADQDLWKESRDVVESEYRGSSTIERYIDPNDTRLPDFGDPANYSKSLGTYYRWRTVAEKQFIP
ncbi:MAG TPA: Verru_Chthon cassette protein A [Candidatus Methylacidiphilales bacterium]|nr:Verru_Chthon cassette protein A [Candidatus Methylacidiphilales bacterium]